MYEPANIPITVWVGNTTTVARIFKYCDNGTAVPLTLADKPVYFTIFNAGTKILEKSTEDGSIIISGTDSERLDLEITPDESRALLSLEYIQDLSHEIEVRLEHHEQTYEYGKIKLKGGSNVDS